MLVPMKPTKIQAQGTNSTKQALEKRIRRKQIFLSNHIKLGNNYFLYEKELEQVRKLNGYNGLLAREVKLKNLLQEANDLKIKDTFLGKRRM